jgi:hypothetical protein
MIGGLDQNLATLRGAVGQDGILRIVDAVHRLGGGEAGTVALFEVMRGGWVVFVRPLGGGPSDAVRVLSA